MVLYEKKITRHWKKKSAIVVLVLAVLALLFPLPLRASAAVISPDGWGWQNPLPQGNHLRDVWGSSASDVFAVGYRGTILHYNGSSWNGMTSGTTEHLYGVWGSSGDREGVITVHKYDVADEDERAFPVLLLSIELRRAPI